jgi:hypothetical protein
VEVFVLLLLVLPSAFAEPAGYYHPDNIASQSARFAEASAVMGPAFETAQTSLSRMGRALENLERNTAFLGPDASDELTSWYEQTQRAVIGQSIQIQRHVDLLQDDYGNVFSSATERAIRTVAAGRELQECNDSGGISSMLSRSARSAPDCVGEDLNAQIASELDQDTSLADELSEINAIPWPVVSIEPTPQPLHSVTGTTRYVSMTALSRYLDDKADRRQEAFEDALAPLEDDIDSGDEAAMAQAAQLKASYFAGLAEDGAVLQAALLKSLSKAAKKVSGFAEVGICANPAALGGCDGEDITDMVMALLKDDNKFQKAMQRL